MPQRGVTISERLLGLRTGDRFGDWTIIDATIVRKPRKRNSDPYVLCRCSCDKQTTKLVNCFNLLLGKTNGCFFKNKVAKPDKLLYNKFSHFNRGTQNRDCSVYKLLGAKGVKMYEPWINNFPNFRDWFVVNLGELQIGDRLERIDHRGNFVPGNLRLIRGGRTDGTR